MGLADFGRPDSYLQRQVRRWTTQLSASRSREVPNFERLGEELGRDIPVTQRTCIVHGDPRLDNAIVDCDEPGRVRALLDWEMSTLGDPLADAALLHLFWQGWSGLDNPIAAVPTEHAFPSFEQLAGRYADATGLRLDHFGWYEAFAYYKFAVICEGIHYRHSQGLTAGEGFDGIGAMVPALVERGRAALQRG